MVRENSGVEWVRADALRQGDHVAIPGRGGFNVKSVSKSHFEPGKLLLMLSSGFQEGIETVSPSKKFRVSRTRRNPMVRENPHRYSVRGRVITFDNGNSYHINEASVRQAAAYLAGPVKIAENAGRKAPKGPHGIDPGAAAVLIHFGRKLLKKRKPATKKRVRRAAPKRKPVAKRRAVRKPVAKRRAVRKPVAKRAPVRRAAPAPRPAPAAPKRAPVDFWDRTAEIYGGMR